TFIFLNTSLIVNTSARTGTSLTIVFPSFARILAAMTGNTAFFAPSTLTVPFNRLPPRTMILSIFLIPFRSDITILIFIDYDRCAYRICYRAILLIVYGHMKIDRLIQYSHVFMP